MGRPPEAERTQKPSSESQAWMDPTFQIPVFWSWTLRVTLENGVSPQPPLLLQNRICRNKTPNFLAWCLKWNIWATAHRGQPTRCALCGFKTTCETPSEGGRVVGYVSASLIVLFSSSAGTGCPFLVWVSDEVVGLWSGSELNEIHAHMHFSSSPSGHRKLTPTLRGA